MVATKSRTGLGRAVTAIVVALAAMVLLWRSQDASTDAATDATRAAQVTQDVESGSRPSIEIEKSDETAADLIESITIEPEAPCAGQSALVSVTTVDSVVKGKVFVGSEAGDRVVVRYDQAGEHTVRVQATDWNTGYQILDVPLDVRECEAPPELTVELKQLGQDEVVVGVAPSSSKFSNLRWDFGDGETSSEVLGEHSYRYRPQAQPTSTFLVTATATDEHGQTIRGIRSVTFFNPLAVQGHTGVTSLPHESERFATIEDNVAFAVVTLKNPLWVDVQWKQVSAVATGCDNRETERVHFSLDEVALAHLPAGAASEFRLALPLSKFRVRPCRALVRLEGEAGNQMVSVPLALELGVPSDARPETNRDRLAMLKAARRILGPGVPITELALERLRLRGLI